MDYHIETNYNDPAYESSKNWITSRVSEYLKLGDTHSDTIHAVGGYWRYVNGARVLACGTYRQIPEPLYCKLPNECEPVKTSGEDAHYAVEPESSADPVTLADLLKVLEDCRMVLCEINDKLLPQEPVPDMESGYKE